MDLRRLTVLLLKSYVDGNSPLPEMTADTTGATGAPIQEGGSGVHGGVI
jgi:hypothetical protein